MIININKDKYIIREEVEDKEIYSTKIVEKLPDDYKHFMYKYVNGKFIRDKEIDFKKNKLTELEKYITNIRSQGVEYKDQLWSIDEECEKNLTSQITLLSFAPTEKVAWFSKTQVNELTINEFKELALVLSNAISQAKLKYYEYKNAIERATTEEEINAIVFEEEIPDEEIPFVPEDSE